MYRKTAFLAIALGFVLCASTQGRAQDTNEASKPSAPKQVNAYRVDFSINELEDGKKLNTRRYSMNLTDDNTQQELKIGTRVPVEAEQGKFDYVDVGTTIRARLAQFKLPMSLDVHADISNFATPEEATRGGRPLLRQMVISGNTTAILDKPIVIGSVDDPNSRREYQLEVTLTKLKYVVAG